MGSVCIQPRRSRSTARSSNHGVTIEAERRFSRGLFFQVAYTAARDMGDTVEWTNTIEDSFDLGRERGHDSATPAHRLTSAVMYELPFGEGRRWMNSAPRAPHRADVDQYLQSAAMGEPQRERDANQRQRRPDSAVGGPSGSIQQADMRRLKLGFRLEW